jgi:transketolase
MPEPSTETSTARAIRIGALLSIHAAGSGHPGGALSCADLLAFLATRELGWGKADPTAPDRNRFVLSKGHACPALYAAAAEAGLIPRRQLLTLRKLGSPLQGHPSVLDLPFVEASTGSLGQGFSAAIGMALGLRHRGSPARVYAMLGDGELQEGEVWEGAMCAAHHRLDNLCAVVDYNKMQSDDLNERILGLEPLHAKWAAFGWNALELDGHAEPAIAEAFAAARACRGRPTVLIAHTKKGRGVSYMEGMPLWHGSVRLRDEELRTALADLGASPSFIARYFEGTLWSEP